MENAALLGLLDNSQQCGGLSTKNNIFVVFLLLNVLRMATTLSATISPNQSSLITAFSDPYLTAILVSRFLLDLQESHQRTVKLGSDDPLHSSASDFQAGIGSLQFAVDVMGSIRADIRPLGDEDDSEEESEEGCPEPDDSPVREEAACGRLQSEGYDVPCPT
ncbi:uncharacterized protein BXZ73DRAFT_104908 [Epithele typhae]|uniref:uncharacterized protein n=1 Tax=Epithele typhae TaxID=378194 RepID=UPI0020073E1B|nr:uncharacterized protein BXZ73DRAFT_104908 [Epithele typhae]KAH9919800.1 hypothetical protein BXZ73DRAFT_104908 [Epithele typhae]